LLTLRTIQPQFWRTGRKEIVVGSKTKPRDFFDPTSEEQVVVLVDRESIRKAEGYQILRTMQSKSGQWPFDVLLDRITGSDPNVTDYILETSALCPNCHRQILEQTLIEP
jgi:hypothetical protein